MGRVDEDVFIAGSRSTGRFAGRGSRTRKLRRELLTAETTVKM